MSKKLIQNTSIYAVGNILPQAANFILLPLFTKFLSPEDFGIISALSVLTSVLAIFFTLAIDRSIFRLYFDYTTEKDKKNFLGTVSIALYAISTLVLIIIFLLNKLVGKIYSSIEFYPFYTYAILAAYFELFGIIPKAYFRVVEKAKVFVLISFIQFIVKNVILILIVVVLKQGASGYLKGMMYSSLVLVPIFLVIQARIINFRFVLDMFKSSIFFSLPVLPNLLSAWVLNLSDRIFLEKYFTLKDLGIYSLSYKIASLVLVFSAAFYSAYSPHFFKVANTNEISIAKKALFKTNTIYVLLILIFSFGIILFSKEIIILLFESEYYSAYKLIPIIVLAYIISQSAGPLNLSIYQNKKTVVVMVNMIIVGVINILLNFLLIPIYGAFGAAYATLITYISLFVIQYHAARRYFFIPYNFKILLPLLILFIAFHSFFVFLDIENMYLSIIIKLIVILIICWITYIKYKKEIVVLFT